MTFTFLNKKIILVPLAKDLGITFDKHLTCDEDIGKLKSSCTAKFCPINYFDRNKLININNALVMNKLHLCLSVWFNSSAGNITKLQHAGPNRKIFSHYSRLSSSAVHRQRIWCIAFHLLVFFLHQTAADNMSLHKWENFC